MKKRFCSSRAIARIVFLLVLGLLLCPAFSPAPAAGQQKLPAGFIALAESPMEWADAKAWCLQQGGKLPRINSSDSLPMNAVFDQAKNLPVPGTRIDGFGEAGRPWAEVGLPAERYWTGTEFADNPGATWLARSLDGKLFNTVSPQNGEARVVCIPK